MFIAAIAAHYTTYLIYVIKSNPNEGIGKEILKDVEWKLRTPDRDYYLEIGEEFQLREDLYKERFDLWDRLFPLADRLNLSTGAKQ